MLLLLRPRRSRKRSLFRKEERTKGSGAFLKNAPIFHFKEKSYVMERQRIRQVG